jgi:hypothetical protein
MPGIYWMAVLTILITAILAVSALNTLTHTDRRYYWLVAIGLPLSLIVNWLIKMPFITAIATLTGTPLKLAAGAPLWFILLLWFNAPIFEEAIKALPLLFPIRRIFLGDATRALYAGLALGMGFGLGEAAYLAYGIAQSTSFNALQWYMFTGFAVERIFVTFAHGLLTSLTILGVQRKGRDTLFGYLSAVGLHALINLGPILLALELIPTTLASLGTSAAIVAAFVVFQKNIHLLRKSSGVEQREIIYYQ